MKHVALLLACCLVAGPVSAQSLDPSSPVTNAASAASASLADAAAAELRNQQRSSPRAAFGGSDSLLNGALIGAGAGIGAALLACRAMEPWSVCLRDEGMMLKFGLLGAAIGAGVDAIVRKQTTVYRAPSGTTLGVSPVIGRRAGVRLNVTF